jgi:hypothetical protein
MDTKRRIMMRYTNEDVHDEKLKWCIQEDNRLKQRLIELNVKRLIVTTLYNLEAREYKGKIVVTACHHWSWDFLVGIGDTEDEAILDLKPRINMYDREFDTYEYNFAPTYIKAK